MDDFYCEERNLGAYFEAEWLEVLRAQGDNTPLACASKPVPDAFVISPFYREVSQFIAACCQQADVAPSHYLEVGPALGRVTYETLRRFPQIRQSWLVEPSQRLLSHCQKLLMTPGCHAFPYIQGLNERGSLVIDTTVIASACQHSEITCINAPFDGKTLTVQADLTVCLNVLDQCQSPLTIMDALKQSTRSGGVLVVSNTYQWQKKHLLDAEDAVDDINQYFEATGWDKLNDTDIGYGFRFNERFSKHFISHVVGYRKRG